MIRTLSWPRLGLLWLVSIWIVPVSVVAQAQPHDEGSETRAAYLQDRGLSEEAQMMKQSVIADLARDNRPIKADTDEYLGIMTTELVMNGYTFDIMSRLKQQGLDQGKLIRRHPITLSLAEKAALSEVVVIATVLDKNDSLVPRDGYRSSVVLKVEEVIRGNVEGEYIILRRFSGTTAKGEYIDRSTDFDGSKGEKYLFFLSNGVYRYSTEYPILSADDIDLAYLAQDPDRHFRYMDLSREESLGGGRKHCAFAASRHGVAQHVCRLKFSVSTIPGHFIS